jgi:hypothetical protein
VIVCAHPASARGAFGHRHQTWSAGSDGRVCVADERCRGGRAKSRGPDPPTLGSSSRVGDVGLRTDTLSRATEANKPGTPRRARISRKPLRRECRCFGVPVAFCFACEPRVRGSIRRSLRPLFRGRSPPGKPRAHRAARRNSCARGENPSIRHVDDRWWLGNLDSNQDKQSQSLLCYRYTIPHKQLILQRFLSRLFQMASQMVPVI